MSFELMAWAAVQQTGSPTRKAVLLALANRANHDTRCCWPSVANIAAETEFSERAVRKALDDLTDAGLIERERRRRRDGSLSTYVYTFPVPDDQRHQVPVDDESLPARDAGRPAAPRAAQNQEEDPLTGKGSPPTPPPTVEIAIEPRRPTWKVAGRPVTLGEEMLAGEILAEWNALLGQTLRSRDWLAKIVMRIREYPDLPLDGHVAVIRSVLADPWWKGVPSPSVVYGNAAIFERSMQRQTQTAHDAAAIAAAAIDARRQGGTT